MTTSQSRAVLCATLLSSWALAQAPAPVATPSSSAVATAAQGLRAAFADPDFVLFDQPQVGGPLWTRGSNFKASFDAQGFTFIGQPRAGAPSLQPIRFHAATARVGERQLAVGAATPSRHDRRIAWERGDLIEVVDVAGRGVEQTFVFPSLPERDELVLEIAVETALAASGSDAGIRFTGAFDEVTYSPAIAIDARGQAIAAPTRLVDGGIEIRVPKEFVARAALPLRVDPWVTSLPVIVNATDIGDPDVAWDEVSRSWGVVYSLFFGGSDWDCYVQRIAEGSPLQLIGTPIPIDVTGAPWNRPAIANVQLFSVFGVVAQVFSGASGRWEIWSRQMANSGTLVTGQLPVAQTGSDELHPDIGGDPTTEARAVFFAVTWEHVTTPNDRDIHANQLFIGGGPGATLIVADGPVNQAWPSISKSAGGGSSLTQRWGIVWQETRTPGDADIWGSLMYWHGVLVPVNGSTRFPLAVSGHNDVSPEVSSPTLEAGDGSRRLLCVFERTSSNNGDVVATVFDQDGGLHGGGNISSLPGDPVRLAWPQHEPSVDSDGDRFFVAYDEVFLGNTQVNDRDTAVLSIGAGVGDLFFEDGAFLATTGAREFNAKVAGQYGGSGLRRPRACVVNDRDGVGFGADAHTFDGLPLPSFAVRATGCGAITIQAHGGTMLGEAMVFTHDLPQALAGFVLGFPQDQPLAGCSGCTLGVAGGTAFGSQVALAIPLDAGLIGVRASAQAFAFQATGPCLGRVHVSDTIDFRVQ